MTSQDAPGAWEVGDSGSSEQNRQSHLGGIIHLLPRLPYDLPEFGYRTPDCSDASEM